MGADLLHHRHLVGDNHHRNTQPPVDVLHQAQNVPGGLWVQGGGGLIAQQNARVAGQGPGDGNALLLPAGQLGGVCLRLVRQAHHLQQLPGAALCVRLFHPGNLHGEADVFQAGALHQQVELLENHADGPPPDDELLGPHGAQVGPVDDDLSGGGPLQQIDAPHQCGLTRPAHAHDAIDVAVADGKGHVLEGMKHSLGGGEHLGYVFQFDHWIALPSLFGVDRGLGTSEQMRLRRFADLSRHNFVVIS